MSGKISRFGFRVSITCCLLAMVAFAARAQISLGTAQSFAVLASSSVSNTGTSTITGNVGVSPGTSVTGFPPGTVTGGTIHAGDAAAAQAQTDLTTAYNAATALQCTSSLGFQDLGGRTLTPGVYCDSGPTLTGTLTLDFQGNPNAFFLFKFVSVFLTADNSTVQVINAGGSTCPPNVFWQFGVNAGPIFGMNSVFVGNILSDRDISVRTGASLFGSALSRTGAVTLDTNTVRGCTVPPLAGVTCPAGLTPSGPPGTGTVTLTAAAPAGGTVVTLTSSAPGTASVPASVTVPAGATSTTFTVTPGATSGTAMITASVAGGAVSCSLSVGPPPLSLGTAQSFAVLASSSVSNTGTSTITGNVGVSPGSSVTGFPPGVVTGGTIHAGDAVAAQAQTDLTTAYDAATALQCTSSLGFQDPGGRTLTSGVYCDPGPTLTGTLTLDFQGNPNAFFLFKTPSVFLTADNSSVRVINTGGSTCPPNVFWQFGVNAGPIFGMNSVFVGNILSERDISLRTGASFFGSALSRTGAVTLDTNTVRACTVLPKGDANGDAATTVADVIYVINSLFAGGPAPIGSGDVNGDSQLTVSDIFYLINHLFIGGPPPV